MLSSISVNSDSGFNLEDGGSMSLNTLVYTYNTIQYKPEDHNMSSHYHHENFTSDNTQVIT
jgi:hypothetical protein